MPISPSSAVYLCGVPLDKNQKHQIRFTDEAAQFAYFYGKRKKTVDANCKIVKGANSTFQVPFDRDDIITCNYMMYQNKAYGSKWFYAFITDIQYVSDGASNITIKTDVYQTWLFDVDMKKSFIERAHINVVNDKIDLIPTVSENLEVGEYLATDKWNIDSGNNLTIIVASTAGAGGVSYETPKYAGIVSGYTFFAFDNDDAGVVALRSWVASLNNDEVIGFVFLVPKYACPPYVNGNPLPSCPANIQTITKNVVLSEIDGYTPKNAKLYMHPYNFMYATTNNGASAVYKYEHFEVIWDGLTATITFQLAANLAIEPRVQVAPRAYKGQTPNYDEAITLDGFPQCSWRSDFYKSWLATNGFSQALAVAGSIVAVAGGVAAAPFTGGASLAIAAGAIGVAQSIGGFVHADAQPNQAKGSNKGSINAAVGNLNITFYQKTIDRFHAMIIDDYFEQYGYKLNDFTSVPVYSRKYWNYVKTIDINVVGDIPADDMTELKSLYDSGITLWHNNGSYFLDYSRNNHEVIA